MSKNIQKEKIREYTADGEIVAYRLENHNKHLVVSRGSKPVTRWEKEIPAEVSYPIPNQKRWTIPDNWNRKYVSNRRNIRYAIYYVPEADMWCEVSEPTNNGLIDAYYHVNKVGDLEVQPVGNLAKSSEVNQFADEYESKKTKPKREEYAKAIRKLSKHWEVVREDLDATTEFVKEEKLKNMKQDNIPVQADENWIVEFSHDTVFKPHIPVEKVADFSDHEISLPKVFDQLMYNDMIPNKYKFKLEIDDSNVDTGYYIYGLIEEYGANPKSAVDYTMINYEEDSDLEEWAERRSDSQSEVRSNINDVKSLIGK